MLTEKKQRDNINKFQKQYYALLLLEILIFIVSIIIAKDLDLSRLFVIEIVNIAFDWAGMFVLIIILYSCIQGRKTSSSYAFINQVFVTFLCLFFEGGIWVVDRMEALQNWNYFCNIGGNIMTLVCAFSFLIFVCKSLEINQKDIRFAYWTSLGVMVIGIIAEILNIYFGYFYQITASGVYVREELGSMLGYIPFIYIFCNAGVLVWKQPMKWSKKMNYFSYIFIPLLISIWYTLTGYPPTLFMASFISLLYIYGNIYIYQGKEMEVVALENLRKDVELAWQRNQLMLSQIKPHFIFNCLGSIEELCRLDAGKARDAVHCFSKYLRVNMDSISDKYLIPFSNELEHIQNYVWLEQMRFEEDLEYKEEIETTNFFLPPLTIQPLVENAIKHGMMGSEDGTLMVILSVKETPDTFEIQIKDNGAGFDPKQKKDDGRSHIGIQNVRESLQSKVDGTLVIKSDIGKGTLVQVSIPKEILK